MGQRGGSEHGAHSRAAVGAAQLSVRGNALTDALSDAGRPGRVAPFGFGRQAAHGPGRLRCRTVALLHCVWHCRTDGQEAVAPFARAWTAWLPRLIGCVQLVSSLTCATVLVRRARLVQPVHTSAAATAHAHPLPPAAPSRAHAIRRRLVA